MKKLVISLSLMAGLSLSATAQTKASKDTILRLPTVQCDLCKARIETYLHRVDGITFVNVMPKKKQVRVKFLKDRTDVEAIKAHIANSGYDAEDVTANPDSYKALPSCCKKPATPTSKN